MNFELDFTHTHFQHLFRTTADPTHSKDIVAKHTEWKYSAYFCTKSTQKKQWGGARWCKILCLYGSRSVLLMLKLLSSVAAIEDLVYDVSGVVCSDAIYERFPLMNEVSLTFEDLFLVEKIHENVDWKDRLEEYHAQGCTLQSSTCLWSLSVGSYWAKLRTKNSCRHAKQHVVALSTLSEHAKCIDPTEKVVCLVDNHYNSIHVQKWIWMKTLTRKKR